MMTSSHPEESSTTTRIIISGGLHGIGVSVVNALSEWLRLSIRRDGKLHQMESEWAKPTGPLKAAGKSEQRGTEGHFLASKEISAISNSIMTSWQSA